MQITQSDAIRQPYLLYNKKVSIGRLKRYFFTLFLHGLNFFYTFGSKKSRIFKVCACRMNHCFVKIL